jgi:hypothetical protein
MNFIVILISAGAILIALIALNFMRESCYRCGKRDWLGRLDGFIVATPREEEVRYYHKHSCKQI